MRTKGCINTTYHYFLNQYSDVQKTQLTFSGYFKTRAELSDYLKCNPQSITDYLRGMSGQSTRKWSPLSYVKIDKLTPGIQMPLPESLAVAQQIAEKLPEPEPAVSSVQPVDSPVQ